MCGKQLLKAAGTVIKKLVKWLAEHGHVDGESADEYADQAGSAFKRASGGGRTLGATLEICCKPSKHGISRNS